MAKNAGKLRWLRKDGGEWEWAYRYMQQTPNQTIQNRLIKAIEGKVPSYGTVADAIVYLQETRDGLELVTNLKNALRQHRHRSLNPDKKRKPYSFTLPTDTKKVLSTKAKELKITETALLTDLINGAGKLLDKHQEKEKLLRIAVDHERKRAKQSNARWDVKHREAMRQIKRLLTRLSIWEITSGQVDPGIEVDQATLESEIIKQTKEIEKAINDALKKHALLEARLI